jgi:hypothetical protein
MWFGFSIRIERVANVSSGRLKASIYCNRSALPGEPQSISDIRGGQNPAYAVKQKDTRGVPFCFRGEQDYSKTSAPGQACQGQDASERSPHAIRPMAFWSQAAYPQLFLENGQLAAPAARQLPLAPRACHHDRIGNHP